MHYRNYCNIVAAQQKQTTGVDALVSIGAGLPVPVPGPEQPSPLLQPNNSTGSVIVQNTPITWSWDMQGSRGAS